MRWGNEPRARRVGAALLLVACASAVALFGCSAEPRRSAGEGCALNSECAAPLVCRLGKCRNECGSTRDCPAAFVDGMRVQLACVRDDMGLGICQLPEETHCLRESDCIAPLGCRNGQCVNTCAEARDCPLGARCLEGTTVCTTAMRCTMGGCIHDAEERCVRDSECPAGKRCATDGFCRIECLSDRDCRFGTTCIRNECVRPPDGGGIDAGGSALDGGVGMDAELADSGPVDGALGDVDAGELDAGVAAPMDAGLDAGPMDSGFDAGPPRDGGPLCPLVRILVDSTAMVGTPTGDTWATAYSDLNVAIMAAEMRGCPEIWVAGGATRRYLPGTMAASTYQLRSGIELYGGFNGTESSRFARDPTMNPTILHGDVLGDDPVLGPSGTGIMSYVDNVTNVVTATGTDATTVLDGFVIQHGGTPAGGGGLLANGTGLIIRSCTFFQNYQGLGLGPGAGGSPQIQDSQFVDNLSGTAVTVGATVRFSRCTFVRNANQGAFVGGVGSIAHFDGCTFMGNGNLGAPAVLGGAMRVGSTTTPSSVTITSSRFLGNIGGFGAGIYLRNTGSVLRLRNVVFSGNRAMSSGGALFVTQGATADLDHVTMTRNSAGSGGGLMLAYNFGPVGGPVGFATVSNSILYGNTSGGTTERQNAYLNGTGTLTISYTTLGGAISTMMGVILSDPLFVSADGLDAMAGTDDDNPRLMATSPAIDAASVMAIPPDELDIDGDGDVAEPLPFDFDRAPRRMDVVIRPDTGEGAAPQPDMGAYEHVP